MARNYSKTLHATDRQDACGFCTRVRARRQQLLTDECWVVAGVLGLGVGEGREGERPAAASQPLLVPLLPAPPPLPLVEPSSSAAARRRRVIAWWWPFHGG